MDKLTVSKRSIWYKLAKLGGFKDYWGSHNSSCTFISKVLLGVLFLAMGASALFDLVLVLISLGMPALVYGWIKGNLGMVLLCAPGGPVIFRLVVFSCGVLLIPFFVAVYVVLGFLSRLPGLGLAKDYLSGICKPLNLTE